MASPVVHLELHTPNLARACGFYTRLLGWETERVSLASAAYQRLDLGAGLSGGVVECGTTRALWLPYAEVPCVAAATERAVELGASVMMAAREGPAGWRSVIVTPDGGELSLWKG